MEASSPILSLSELSIATTATGVCIIDGVSFDVRRSEIVALVGESGAGKTLAALAVMRLLPPDRMRVVGGRIQFEGMDLLDRSERDLSRLRGAKMAMVFQEPLSSLNPAVKCGPQTEDPLRFHTDLGRRARRERVLDTFRLVRLADPDRIYDAFPRELSGGQRQRVLFAMAMMLRPTFLICDEPTTALDAPIKMEILDLIRTLRDETGVTILLITHDLGLVARTADRVAVIKSGRIVEVGSTAEILQKSGSDYTRRLVADACTPQTQAVGLSRPPSLEARDLVKRFDSAEMLFAAPSQMHAVDGVSLSIGENERVGLVGESGAGKTTLARCLCGLTVPEEGSVKIDGQDLAVIGGRAKARPTTVQMVFQDPYSSLNPAMTAGAAVGEGLRARGEGEEVVKSRAVEMLCDVGLDESYYGRFPSQLSGGERQRVAIARALIVRPKLLIADEPVSALDLAVQSQIIELLAHLRDAFQMSLLIISHDMNVVTRICERVLVMYEGQIVEQGATTALFERPSHPYTQHLVSSAREMSYASQSLGTNG